MRTTNLTYSQISASKTRYKKPSDRSFGTMTVFFFWGVGALPGLPIEKAAIVCELK